MKFRKNDQDRQREADEEDQDWDYERDDSNEIRPSPQISGDWTELEQWKLFPKATEKRKDFGIITKDGALTNMGEDDINISGQLQDLAFQCYKYGFTKAGEYFEFINDSDVVTRRSLDGFERKQQSTVHQKKDVEITRRKGKARMFQ